MNPPSPPAPGPYLQTVSGRFVNPFEPDPEQLELSDMPHPIKHRSPLGAQFKQAEAHLEAVLAARFAIKTDVPDIKRVDRALLATERVHFSAENWHWPELEGVEPLELQLRSWAPDEAERAFSARFEELSARRHQR
jgi:uncharacterized protein